MKNLHSVLGAILLTFTFNLTAQQSGEWVELINGKDFSDWKASENPETWSVTEGVYQAVGKRAHLFYSGPELKDGFKNFEIDVWVKTFQLANSGIYFHTKYQESGWPSNGFEIQVNHSHIGEGDYVEYKKMGSLYGYRNLYKSFGKDGDWMNVKARVESNRVQIWIDGLKTVDYVQSETPQKGVRRLSNGTFALQGHDVLSKMQYRSFKVRRLPDDAHSNINTPIFGAWHDSLRVWSGRQYAFLDINPNSNMSPAELADYTYQTGINISILKSPSVAKELNAAQNLPIFKGIKVTDKTLKDLTVTTNTDYILGESKNLKSAKTLLSSGKIHVWAHKGKALTVQNAESLLDIAKQNNVALVIDNDMKTPSVEVLKLAKSKGLKFTFSGLVPVSRMEKSNFAFQAIKEAGLDYRDIYVPK